MGALDGSSRTPWDISRWAPLHLLQPGNVLSDVFRISRLWPAMRCYNSSSPLTAIVKVANAFNLKSRYWPPTPASITDNKKKALTKVSVGAIGLCNPPTRPPHSDEKSKIVRPLASKGGPPAREGVQPRVGGCGA